MFPDAAGGTVGPPLQIADICADNYNILRVRAQVDPRPVSVIRVNEDNLAMIKSLGDNTRSIWLLRLLFLPRNYD